MESGGIPKSTEVESGDIPGNRFIVEAVRPSTARDIEQIRNGILRIKVDTFSEKNDSALIEINHAFWNKKAVIVISKDTMPAMLLDIPMRFQQKQFILIQTRKERFYPELRMLRILP